MNKVYKHNFKVGDKVVNQNKMSSTQIGTVKFVDDNGDCAIRFEAKDNPNMIVKSILATESAFLMDNYFDLYKEEAFVTISIMADPKTRRTIASCFEDGKLVAEGVARCNPEDEWDAMLGTQLAFRRMLDKLDCTVVINAEDILNAYKKVLGMED